MQSEIGNWFSKLKSIEVAARGTCETYKEAEESFIESKKEVKLCIEKNQTNQIRHKIEKKEKAEERLMKLGRMILQEKDKYLRVVVKIKQEFQQKTNKIGMFAKDLTMKNFIYQVNNLKNREYDLNQIIEDFNGKWDQPGSKSPKADLKEIEDSIQQNTLTQQFRSLPFKLDIPEKEFFKFLEEEFYKGIHHDLLGNLHLMDPTQQQKISYALFEEECIIFSKLLDELTLSKSEKNVLSQLPMKDKKGYFVDKFLESFLRYKKKNVVLNGATMHFLISKIIDPLFVLLAGKNEFERIYNILLQIQMFKIKSNLVSDKQSKSAVFTKKRKNKSMLSSGVFEKKNQQIQCDGQSLREWLCSTQQKPFGVVFASKEFWAVAFNKIFSGKNNSASTSDSSLIEKSLVLGNSMAIYQNEPENNENLSFFQQIKKKGQKLMNLHNEETRETQKVKQSFSLENELEDSKSVNKDEQISEIKKEIMNELIFRNLLSCKSFLDSQDEFEYVLDCLDEKLQQIQVKKMWDSVDVSTYFESEVKNLTLFCFQRKDLKNLKISTLIKQIAIFE